VLIALCLVLTWSGYSQVCQPIKFVSDGCTAPNQYDHLTKASYVKCCYIHDIAYYVGGSEEKRKQADHQLRSCVEKKILAAGGSFSHAKRTASAIFMAVRIAGGTSYNCLFDDNYWEWGFAWKDTEGCFCRERPDHLALTRVNRETIAELRARASTLTEAEVALLVTRDLRNNFNLHQIMHYRKLHQLEKIIDGEVK
jgi:hypothetical protein